MKIWRLILLVLLVLVACAVKFYRFNNPIADWHSWRQADTSAVSRNFVKHGFNLLYPTYDDISNVQTGQDNPKGYRFVEFPLYNLAQAGFFQIFGHFTLEEWGRLVTIFISVLGMTFVYLLGELYGNWIVGISAAFFFGLIPYNIYYDRTILPDPSMTTAILGGMYFFSLWAEKNSKFNPTAGGQNSKLKENIKNIIYLFLSFLFTASALLLKPYGLFWGLPFIWIAWNAFGRKFVLRPFIWILLIISVVPLILWRLWIQQYPQGIPASSWLFNGGNIRFTGAYFYWIFAERLSKLILGYFGIVFIFLGIISITKKSAGFFLTVALSSLIYLVVIARGNVQHDYYQILIIPSLAFLFGLGIDFLISFPKSRVQKLITYFSSFVVIVFMLIFGWYQVRDYFNINNPSVVAAGQAVQKFTPKNALVIAPYNGDTSLLYQTDRKGWPSFEKSLPDLIKMGADYLVFVNTKPSDYNLGKTYKIISATPDYILFNLQQKP